MISEWAGNLKTDLRVGSSVIQLLTNQGAVEDESALVIHIIEGNHAGVPMGINRAQVPHIHFP
jgi:hypothetical protein